MVFGYEEIPLGVGAIADWSVEVPWMVHPSHKGREICPAFQQRGPSTHRVNLSREEGRHEYVTWMTDCNSGLKRESSYSSSL